MKDLKTLPKKRVHHCKNGIHLFVNPFWGGKFITDDTGTKIIELIDQESDKEKLIELIAQELKINSYEAAARFITFYEQLETRKMLGEAVGDNKDIPKPDIGFIEITRKCATRCRLCYVDSGEEKPDALSKSEIFETIDQMADMGIGFIVLSGGDPLTNGDMLEILEYINKKRKLKAGISTSLLTLTEDVAKKMKELNVLVQVSLDGSTSEVNDWNRGKGSYEKTMQGLKLLKRYEIPFRFAYVINKHNVEDVEDMVMLGHELGAIEVAFGKVKIAGRAKGQEEVAYPGVKEMASTYHKLYRKEIEMRQTGVTIRCKHNQALLTGLHDRVGCLPCGAGRTFVHVSYNGNIVPCSLLSNEKEFYLGNVKKDKIKDIWDNSPTFEFFRKTTADDIEICRNCPAKYLCGGGCRADAYLNHKDLNGPCGDCEDLIYYYERILDRGCKEKNITAF